MFCLDRYPIPTYEPLTILVALAETYSTLKLLFQAQYLWKYVHHLIVNMYTIMRIFERLSYLLLAVK